MGNWHLTPWWGLWTFFAGLVLGFVREKTGSIVAPTILHGLPQAIAAAFLGI
jgi:membrane protease YdiL (CAAX protease family)